MLYCGLWATGTQKDSTKWSTPPSPTSLARPWWGENPSCCSSARVQGGEGVGGWSLSNPTLKYGLLGRGGASTRLSAIINDFMLITCEPRTKVFLYLCKLSVKNILWSIFPDSRSSFDPRVDSLSSDYRTEIWGLIYFHMSWVYCQDIHVVG